LDYDRFLFNLGANEMSPFDSTDALSDTAVHLRPSSLHPSDSETVRMTAINGPTSHAVLSQWIVTMSG
jgi:hypothetical protein